MRDANRKSESRSLVRGLTLLETLVSIAVMLVLMGTAYATIQHSLKLHEASLRESVRMSQRCDFAERLTADFRAHKQLRANAADGWTITRADGTTVAYRLQQRSVLRAVVDSPEPSERSFDTGRLSVFFRDINAAWSTEPSNPVSIAAMRVRFTDSELVIAR